MRQMQTASTTPKRTTRKPRRFAISYAYDVPHYADFIIEANSEAEALRIARAALKAGRFANVCGDPCFDNMNSERVFCAGAADDTDASPLMDELDDIAPAQEPRT